MTKAVVMSAFGSKDVLKISQNGANISHDTDIIISHKAIGLNNYDIRQRRGDFAFDKPLVPGCEAVGVVEEVGPGVKFFEPGDRVAYATVPFGAYAEGRVIDEAYLVPVPDIVNDKDAAALLYKAMTAHYLLRRAFFVSEKNTILVMNGAKDIGLFLTKLARHYKCKVIATVNNDQEKVLIKDIANYVIDYSKDNVAEAVTDYTKGNMVNVVYDPFGRGSSKIALDCLSILGLFVSYDAITGVIESLETKALYEKCNFVTFPNLFTYKVGRQELLLSANEVFALFQQKIILPDITEYKLNNIQKAHEDYEGGRIRGQAVITL